MYTVQIQRYSINTTSPAAPQARLQGFMNTTHFIYIYSKIPQTKKQKQKKQPNKLLLLP